MGRYAGGGGPVRRSGLPAGQAADARRPGCLGRVLRLSAGGLALLGGPAIGALALVAGSVLGVSQREGAFAMGVVFVIAPIGAILVGLGVGVWRGLRAWRR